jgi:hypothetical protein
VNLTRRNGSPAPTHLKVSREWTYDVTEAGLSLAEFTDEPIYYEDVLEMIRSWMPDDVQEPINDNLPAILEVYVTEDTRQEQNTVPK